MPRAVKTPESLPFTGDPRADKYLVDDPLALLIGMVLDQQVPLEKAFAGPWVLRQRLGTKLDAAKIAAMPSDELTALFVERPALHRFPGSMAARVQDLCRLLVDDYGGNAAAIWTTAATGDELFKRVKALPGFGEHKARIFVALLGKRLGRSSERLGESCRALRKSWITRVRGRHRQPGRLARGSRAQARHESRRADCRTSGKKRRLTRESDETEPSGPMRARGAPKRPSRQL